jgi:hypothetical protein
MINLPWYEELTAFIAKNSVGPARQQQKIEIICLKVSILSTF